VRELEPGTMIDERYRVISRIGSGGMADVYCCEDLQLGRKVAVKVLHQRFAEDQEFVERFRREASSAAALSHPNVVGVFDRGEWDGTYYIAMEYLEGRSLKALVREQGPLDPLHAIEIASQILRAARFAHHRGVVHRDVKPQNVIVDNEGLVKVTDFGIARAGASEITQTGSIMGTAQYLSPEQAQGQAVSPRSDLYSIGILLYELLTGRIPFDGDSAVTIALKQISELPQPPSVINPAVSPELDAIVLRALEKDPANRFQDAEEFFAALEAERERLRADGAGRTAEFGVAPAPLPEQEVYDVVWEPNPAGEPLPPRNRRMWPWALVGVLAAAALVAGLVLLLSPGKRRVPDVVGQQEAAASATLQNAGFEPVPLHVQFAAPQGVVIRESPHGGAEAQKGSLVRITVSDGPGSMQLRDVTGLRSSTAKRLLVKDGFEVVVSPVFSDAVAKGRVISTTPPPFSQLQRGTAVTLNVSSGAQLLAVPDVKGQPKDNATTILQAAGFTTAATEVESTQPPGTVLGQTPAAGAHATKGSVVVLRVAKAPTQVVVPSVIGKTESDAFGIVAAAGLKPTSTNRSVPDQAQDGTVIAQNPAAGAQVHKGATVRLVIGRFSPPTTPTTTTPPPVTPPKP
jgi:serine/threonine-protein kinase